MHAVNPEEIRPFLETETPFHLHISVVPNSDHTINAFLSANKLAEYIH